MLPTPTCTLDLPGFTLGHGTDRDALTGVTVILCPEGALAAAEVRGSATGTRQFDALVFLDASPRMTPLGRPACR